MKSIITTISLIFLSQFLVGQALTATITNAVNDCKSGCIDLHINSGYAPYSVTWYDSTGNQLSASIGLSGNDGQEDLCGLYPGTYTVEVYDDLCGFASATFIINKENYIYNPRFEVVNVCSNNPSAGSVSVVDSLIPTKGSGNYSYKWTMNSNFYSNCPPYTISNLHKAQYCLIAKDESYNCEFKKCTKVNIFNAPTYTIDKVTRETDNGTFDGSIEITTYGTSAPYAYFWDGPNGFSSTNEDIFGLGFGIYNCTITDKNGCEVKFSVEVKLQCHFDIVYRVRNICQNQGTGNIIIADNNNCNIYQFKWSNGSTDCSITNLSVGNYTVTITSPDTCINVLGFTIKNDSLPPIKIDIMHICKDQHYGYAELIGDYNGWDIFWSSPFHNENKRFNLNEAAKCCLSGVSFTNSCTIDTCVNVLESMPMNIRVEDTYGQCSKKIAAQITAKIDGGIPPFIFKWNNIIGNDTFYFPINDVVWDSVKLEVIDAAGCSITQICRKPEFVTDKNIKTRVYSECWLSHGAVRIIEINNMVNPVDISWNNGEKGYLLSDAKHGETYWADITDARGCSQRIYVGVNDESLYKSFFINSKVKHSCHGQANGFIELDYSSDYIYVWSNNKNTYKIDNLLPGIYSVLVFSVTKQCVFRKTFEIIPLNGNFPARLLGTCNGKDGSIEIDQSFNTHNNLSIKWDDNYPNYFKRYNLDTGLYKATITYYDCVFPSSYRIYSFSDSNSISSYSVNPCKGFKNGIISATNQYGAYPLKYTWVKLPFDTITVNSNQSTIVDLSDGNYALTITDSRGCSVSKKYNLNNGILDTINVGCERKIRCDGYVIKIVPKIIKGFVWAYIWNPTKDEIRIKASSLQVDSFNVVVMKLTSNGWQKESTFKMNGTKDYKISTNGEYLVIVSDGVCEREFYFTVCSKEIKLCSSPKIFPCSGNGSNDGSIQLVSPIFCSYNSKTMETDTLNENDFSFYWVRIADGFEFGVNENIITNLSSGDYKLVYRRNDCWSGLFEKTFTITCDCDLNVSLLSINNTCPYQYDGKIRLKYNNYNYIPYWSNGKIGDPEIYGLAEGFYSVNIIDKSTGCKKFMSFEIKKENITPTHVDKCTYRYICNGRTYDVDMGIKSSEPIPETCNNLVTCNVFNNTYIFNSGFNFTDIISNNYVCIAKKICNNGTVIDNNYTVPRISNISKEECKKRDICIFEGKIYEIPGTIQYGILSYEGVPDTCLYKEACSFENIDKFYTGKFQKGTSEWFQDNISGNWCNYQELCKYKNNSYFTNKEAVLNYDTCYVYHDNACYKIAYCEEAILKTSPYATIFKTNINIDSVGCDKLYKNSYEYCYFPIELYFGDISDRNQLRYFQKLGLDVEKIYPNPFLNQIKIDIFTIFNQTLSISIKDIVGKEVYNQYYSTQTGNQTIDLEIPELPSGIYELHILNKELNIKKSYKIVHHDK